MKNSNNTIGNRTHNLPACSAVPQPTALPCAHAFKGDDFNFAMTSHYREPLNFYELTRSSHKPAEYHVMSCLRPGIIASTAGRIFVIQPACHSNVTHIQQLWDRTPKDIIKPHYLQICMPEQKGLKHMVQWPHKACQFILCSHPPGLILNV